MLDQVEERVLAPLDVVDEDDERRLLAEELPERPGDLLHRRRLFALAEQRADGRGGRRVGGQGVELLDHLDNGPVCDLLAVGKAARSDDTRVHPLERLGNETRLADTGLAEHGHELARALGARALPRPTNKLQLTRASDEGSVVRDGQAPPDREEAKRRHRLRLPFQGQRRELLGLGRRADQRARRRADEHLARVSRLFQPGRDVHGIPGDQRADLARQDLARVHPDPCPELEFRHRIPHLRRRPQRAQGVVLVRDRDAEDSHDGVADELLDGAAVPLDDRLHPLEVPPQERSSTSGSVESPRAVDPARSQNTTVTVLRTSRVAAADPSAAPQPLQKPAPTGLSRPQLAQMSTSRG